MLIRRERAADAESVRAVHRLAFAGAPPPGGADDAGDPIEVGLVDALRDGHLVPGLSLVAVHGSEVIGHVCCSRGYVGVAAAPALGLGPIGVRPANQRSGVGSALMYAVLGAADALDEPVVVLLGDPGWYERFGFEQASAYGVLPPDPAWNPHFLLRRLTAWDEGLRGEFRYAAPFDDA